MMQAREYEEQERERERERERESCFTCRGVFDYLGYPNYCSDVREVTYCRFENGKNLLTARKVGTITDFETYNHSTSSSLIGTAFSDTDGRLYRGANSVTKEFFITPILAKLQPLSSSGLCQLFLAIKKLGRRWSRDGPIVISSIRCCQEIR